MNDIGFVPFSNYVVAELVSRATSKIIRPETAKPDVQRADLIIVAVSEDKDDNGNPMVRNVKVGDKVLIDSSHSLIQIKPHDKDLFVFRESDVIGKITPVEADLIEEAVFNEKVN